VVKSQAVNRWKWKAKVLTQFALAKIPFGERVNYALQTARGRYTVTEQRADILSGLQTFERMMQQVCLRDSVIVEIGTGWRLLSSLLMYVFGAREVYTYDHVRHLRFRTTQLIVHGLKDMTAELVKAGAVQERIDAMQAVQSLDQLLSVCNIHYFAPGDGTATSLPDKSVDLFYSFDVLPHVPPAVLHALIRESRRILKPSGVAYHAICAGDHYSTFGTSGVNFLRYSDRAWNFWVQNKISYHNRLRAKEYLEAFEQHGATIKSYIPFFHDGDMEVLQNGIALNPRFKRFSLEELAVYRCEVAHSF
jgi:SAM-dependent methyltransferase